MNIAKLRQACTLPNICRLFALLMVAWQPLPGSYRVPLIGSALLGLAICQRKQLEVVAEPIRRLGLLLACLVIPALLSVPTSLAPGKSWMEIASLALVALTGICVLYGLQRQADHRCLQTALLVTIAAWVGDGLWQATTGADVFGIVAPEGFVTGPFRPNAIFGIVIVILLPLTFWNPLKQGEPWGLALLCSTLVVITLTGQRNNLVLAVVAIICLSTLWKPRTRLLAAAAFTALMISAIPLSTALQQKIGTMAQSVAELAPQSSASQGGQNKTNDSQEFLSKLNKISTDRGYLFEAGFKMIQKNPLTGVGIGAYKKVYPQFTSESPARQNIHSHHIYMGIAAETGIIGLGFFIYSIYLAWRWFAVAPIQRREAAAPYAYSLIVMLFPLATHTSLFRAFHFCIFLMVLCGFISALFSPMAALEPSADPPADYEQSNP